MQSELLKPKNGYFTHIVGIVYGDREDFIKCFNGVFENKIFTLKIMPDGEIILHPEGNEMFLQNFGFHNKVQMPGKILLKKVNETAYSPSYDTFKDKNGRYLKNYFRIENDTASFTN